MATVFDVTYYVTKNYPKDDLSKTKITKIVYLIDWKSSIERFKQITPIKWYFNHFGPYVRDVIDTTLDNPEYFNVDSYENEYEHMCSKISLKKFDYEPKFTTEEKEIIDFVLNTASEKSFNAFIKLIYRTYPVKNSDRYSYMDLVEYAKEYEPIREKRIQEQKKRELEALVA